MASEQQPVERKSVAQLLKVQPVDEATAATADKILDARTKENGDLEVKSAKYAFNPKLKKQAVFNYRKKLILAEVLKLIADSVDPEKQESIELDQLTKKRKKLKSAINVGVGQMVERLRPMEIMANQVQMWKANSGDTQSPNLPQNQTGLVLGPNMFLDDEFQKVIEHEMKQTNLHIARGEYRSFMFLPFDDVEGGSSSLIPYLKMASRLHFHIVGSLSIDNSLDEMGRLKDSWRFRLNDAAGEEDILANATIVVNEAVIRKAHEDYHESEPLKCGLNYSFGSQMTKYFQRQKEGHWYIPVMHPKGGASLQTVNTVDVKDSWQDAVSNQFNFAYTVTKSQDAAEAGIKIYGATTTFPEAEVGIENMGNQGIPKVQSQARVTRNRIYYFLVTELERYTGGTEPESTVRKTVGDYLTKMKSNKQIAGWKIQECSKDETGKYKIRLSIGWDAAAREFEIDAESGTED